MVSGDVALSRVEMAAITLQQNKAVRFTVGDIREPSTVEVDGGVVGTSSSRLGPSSGILYCVGATLV